MNTPYKIIALVVWSIGLGDCKIQLCVFQHFLNYFFHCKCIEFPCEKIHIHEILNKFRVNRVFKASKNFLNYFQKFKHAFSFECPLHLRG